MNLIIAASEARPFRADRYGTVFEIVGGGGATPLCNVGFALVTVDAGRCSPAHYHRCTEELYYIVEGRGRMRLGSEIREVGPGDTICIRPNVVHAIENVTSAPLRFVCVTAPPYDQADDFEIAT
jgi:mannose-6-phosphate isomerase-like protein (cupin superfamily)